MSGQARVSPTSLVPDYLLLERHVCAALQGSRCPTARLLPSELVHLVVSFLWSPLTSLSRQLHNPRQRSLWTASLALCTGWIHGDTQQYDDWTSELSGLVMAGWRLRAIDGYGGPTQTSHSTPTVKPQQHANHDNSTALTRAPLCCCMQTDIATASVSRTAGRTALRGAPR